MECKDLNHLDHNKHGYYLLGDSVILFQSAAVFNRLAFYAVILANYEVRHSSKHDSLAADDSVIHEREDTLMAMVTVSFFTSKHFSPHLST